MINLIPSRGVENMTGINFKILSQVLTTALETAHGCKLDMNVKVHKSRIAGTSLCDPIDRHNFLINLDRDNVSRRYQWTAILHELRHCVQFHLFNYWPDTVKFKSFNAYYQCVEERDARKAEKLYKEIYQMYSGYTGMLKKFKDLNLNKIVGA